MTNDHSKCICDQLPEQLLELLVIQTVFKNRIKVQSCKLVFEIKLATLKHEQWKNYFFNPSSEQMR